VASSQNSRARARLALLIEIRTEPARREDPDRNERRGRILDVFDRGVRRRAGAATATATGEFQSVVLGASSSTSSASASACWMQACIDRHMRILEGRIDA
jgi:hypothetical protein